MQIRGPVSHRAQCKSLCLVCCFQWRKWQQPGVRGRGKLRLFRLIFIPAPQRLIFLLYPGCPWRWRCSPLPSYLLIYDPPPSQLIIHIFVNVRRTLRGASQPCSRQWMLSPQKLYTIIILPIAVMSARLVAITPRSVKVHLELNRQRFFFPDVFSSFICSA